MSLVSERGPWLPKSAITDPFTFLNIPKTIDGGSSSIITVHFNPLRDGNFTAYLRIYTNGGGYYKDVRTYIYIHADLVIRRTKDDYCHWEFRR